MLGLKASVIPLPGRGFLTFRGLVFIVWGRYPGVPSRAAAGAGEGNRAHGSRRPGPHRHQSIRRARGASGPRPDWSAEEGGVTEAALQNLHFLEADRVFIGFYAVRAELPPAALPWSTAQKRLPGGARWNPGFREAIPQALKSRVLTRVSSHQTTLRAQGAARVLTFSIHFLRMALF